MVKQSGNKSTANSLFLKNRVSYWCMRFNGLIQIKAAVQAVDIVVYEVDNRCFIAAYSG